MKEIERKILDIDVKSLGARIMKLSPRPRKIFEGLVKVWYFDFPDGRIRRAKDLVRIRAIFPKKGAAYTEVVYKKYEGVKKGCKIFDEQEFTIPGGDAEKAAEIFHRLGLSQTVYYEKKRTLYRQGNIAFEIDEHPRIPPFVEIEAPSPVAIEGAIRLLGLQKHEQTAETISELLKRKYPKIRLDGLRF